VLFEWQVLTALRVLWQREDDLARREDFSQ
jgi:hypothetical protein